MEIKFSEQDVVDSVCVYVASIERTAPEDVDVDLRFDKTISAYTVFNRFEKKLLDEKEIIDAIAVYLRDYYSFDPNLLRIDLQFSEEGGIEASIRVD